MTTKTRNQWQALSSRSTSWDEEAATSATGGETPDLMGVLNKIVGYDLLETQAVRADRDLHIRATNRLNEDTESVAAEDVLGDLDSE